MFILWHRPGDSTDNTTVLGDPGGEPFEYDYSVAFRQRILVTNDPVFDAYSIRQLYEEAQDTSGTIHSFIMVKSSIPLSTTK
jgi:hypothetical protein